MRSLHRLGITFCVKRQAVNRYIIIYNINYTYIPSQWPCCSHFGPPEPCALQWPPCCVTAPAGYRQTLLPLSGPSPPALLLTLIPHVHVALATHPYHSLYLGYPYSPFTIRSLHTIKDEMLLLTV